jgi:hypothetical protein
LTLASVAGDVSAEGRLLVTDAASQNRRYVEWGLQWRYYDAATSLLVDSDDMTVSGFSGAQTTRTGAYDPNGTGNNVIRGTLYEAASAICGTGNLGHIGTFRVKARVFVTASVTTPTYVRLSWQEGDGAFKANAYVTPLAAGSFSEVDLGLITIPPKQLGTQRWSGRIEAYTSGAAGTDTLDIDYLVLIPADEGYGKVRATFASSPGVRNGYDNFNSLTAGTALNTRTATTGGTWATSGSTTDFAGASGTGTYVTRATASDASRRFAVLGTATPTDVEVGATVTIPHARGTQVQGGVLARWVDASNYVEGITDANYGLQIQVVVAGTVVATGNIAGVTQGVDASAGAKLAMTVFASGKAVLVAYSPSGGIIATATVQHAALATGGALASGKSGIVDMNPGAALTRSYDDFYTAIPAAEPIALYSGRTAEIRFDGAIRQDSTGTYYGPVPAYRGSRFLVPPAGDENRTSRILVKAHRNDIETGAADNVTDNLTIQTIITPRYLVAPF